MFRKSEIIFFVQFLIIPPFFPSYLVFGSSDFDKLLMNSEVMECSFLKLYACQSVITLPSSIASLSLTMEHIISKSLKVPQKAQRCGTVGEVIPEKLQSKYVLHLNMDLSLLNDSIAYQTKLFLRLTPCLIAYINDETGTDYLGNPEFQNYIQGVRFLWIFSQGAPFGFDFNLVADKQRLSKFIILHIENFTQVKMVSFGQDKIRSVSLNEVSTTNIRVTWLRLHSNLLSSVLSNFPGNISDFSVDSDPNKVCQLYSGKKVEIHGKICVLLTLSRLLNFSLEYNEQDLNLPSEGVQGILRMFQMPSKHNANLAKKFGWSWLPYGIRDDLFWFILVFRNWHEAQVATKVNGMLKPFGGWIWLLLTLTSVFTAVLYTIAQRDPVNFWLFSRTWFKLISLLLEQGSSIGSCTFPILVILSLWNLSALNLTQIYKGVMFSSLSSGQPGHVPENLRDLLAAEDLPLGTIVMCPSPSGNRSHPEVSCLKDVIIPELVQLHDSDSSSLEKLRKKLLWFQTNSWELFSYIAIANGSASVNRDGWMQNFQLPERFALLEPDFSMNYLTSYFQSAPKSKSIWISKPKPLPIFKTRLFWTSFGNWFGTVFQRSIGRLYENGMYSRWDKYSTGERRATGVFNIMKKVANSEDETYWNDYKSKVRMKFMYCDGNLCGGTQERGGNLLQPISGSVYFGMMTYWLGAVAGIVTVFAGELLSVQMGTMGVISSYFWFRLPSKSYFG